MPNFNVKSTRRFESKLHPGATFEISILTPAFKRHIEACEAATPLEERGYAWEAKSIWDGLVVSSNVKIDEKEVPIGELFWKLPEDLASEVTDELVRQISGLNPNDDADQRIIRECEAQIAAARARVEARKNSEPASSPATTDAGTQTAGAVSETDQTPVESETSEIVTGVPV